MNFYSVGNDGDGTKVYFFKTKKQRDRFVGWDTRYDQRRAVTRQEGRRYNKVAILLSDGELVPDGHGYTTINI